MTEPVTTAKTVAPAATTEAVVRIQGLSKSFDGRLVLDNVNLEVDRGRIVSVIGQSGGGKTTLMRCVNLLERPDGGTVEVAGEVVHDGGRMVCRDLPRLRRTVGMVFQRFNLFPHLTAVENVVLAQRKAGVPEQEALSGPSRSCAGSGWPTAASPSPSSSPAVSSSASPSHGPSPSSPRYCSSTSPPPPWTPRPPGRY